MASKSYVLAMLRIIASSPTRNILIGDLAVELRDGRGGNVRLPFNKNSAVSEMVAAITPALLELDEIGVVRFDGESVSTAGGDAPPPPPPNLPPQGNDGDGGSGLGQVLAHPILFSYSAKDFERALDDALLIFN